MENTVVVVLGVKFLPVFDTLHGELPQSVYACMTISHYYTQCQLWLNFYNC